ncbi:hypothetical protein N658DRAFT_275900 [Parathielavia hyrcaniae]|uniref:Uncharacterized protein n=1 Tax=Parathielavia hyrcaniae TaxID=113614 RepID=A0AAN6T492_9PEZI|nr:hypothetical protein N658DRAFT_275900 [Parathielavia hyrcaniae]
MGWRWIPLVVCPRQGVYRHDDDDGIYTGLLIGLVAGFLFSRDWRAGYTMEWFMRGITSRQGTDVIILGDWRRELQLQSLAGVADDFLLGRCVISGISLSPKYLLEHQSAPCLPWCPRAIF